MKFSECNLINCFSIFSSKEYFAYYIKNNVDKMCSCLQLVFEQTLETIAFSNLLSVGMRKPNLIN